MQTAVIFGAGNVGRGFIGEVLSDAGLGVTFVDINEEVINALNREGSYTHITVDNGLEERKQVSPVRAVSSFDQDEVSRACVEASILVTCVGVRALPAVCAAIARGIRARIDAGCDPIDLVIAENLHDSRRLITQWILDTGVVTKDELDQNLGLVTASIGRMIPAPREAVSEESPTAIEVEPYRFLPLDAAAAKRPLPRSSHLVVDSEKDFAFYEDRKLYVHNMGHSMCAYLGALLGDEFIWQTIGRVGIRYFVRNAMVESVVALCSRYGQDVAPLLDHIDDLLHRFGNRELRDTVQRVGRDPLRKLAPGDRFQGALEQCETFGVFGGHIGLGLAAGMRSLASGDNQAFSEVSSQIRLVDLGLSSQMLKIIEEQYQALESGVDVEKQIAILECRFQVSRIP